MAKKARWYANDVAKLVRQILRANGFNESKAKTPGFMVVAGTKEVEVYFVTDDEDIPDDEAHEAQLQMAERYMAHLKPAFSGFKVRLMSTSTHDAAIKISP